MMPGILSSHALVAPQGRSTLGVGRHEPNHSLFHEVSSQGGGKQPHTGKVTERDGTGSPPPPVKTKPAEERSANNNSNKTLRLETSGGFRRPRCRGADAGGPSPPPPGGRGTDAAGSRVPGAATTTVHGSRGWAHRREILIPA